MLAPVRCAVPAASPFSSQAAAGVSAATGYLPIDYVHALRIEEAKQFIGTETGSIDDVGLKIGYEDPTFFRRLFKRQTGLTPAAYRRKFAGMLSVGK